MQTCQHPPCTFSPDMLWFWRSSECSCTEQDRRGAHPSPHFLLSFLHFRVTRSWRGFQLSLREGELLQPGQVRASPTKNNSSLALCAADIWKSVGRLVSASWTFGESTKTVFKRRWVWTSPAKTWMRLRLDSKNNEDLSESWFGKCVWLKMLFKNRFTVRF